MRRTITDPKAASTPAPFIPTQQYLPVSEYRAAPHRVVGFEVILGVSRRV